MNKEKRSNIMFFFYHFLILFVIGFIVLTFNGNNFSSFLYTSIFFGIFQLFIIYFGEIKGSYIDFYHLCMIIFTFIGFLLPFVNFIFFFYFYILNIYVILGKDTDYITKKINLKEH